MSEQPGVSIFIITYLNTEERGEVLRKTCERVLQMNYDRFEVVVSDNCSPFSVDEALSSISDPRLKICHNDKNAGFTGNMNRCLKFCSYEIIKPLCDDDILHKDTLSLTVPLVDDNTLVAVDVESFTFGTLPAFEKPLAADPVIGTRSAGYGMDMWNLSYADSCIPSALIFTKNLFRELGGLSQHTELSDWDFFAEGCLKKTIKHVQFPLCYVGVWDEAETFIKLRDEPYFFAHEGLYTSFRILHGAGLGAGEKVRLLWDLKIKFLKNCLIPVKHPFSKAHYSGCIAYIKRFFQLLFAKADYFEHENQFEGDVCG